MRILGLLAAVGALSAAPSVVLAEGAVFRTFSDICIKTQAAPEAVKAVMTPAEWTSVDPASLPKEKLALIDGLKDYSIWVRTPLKKDTGLVVVEGFLNAGKGGNACLIADLSANPEAVRDAKAWIGEGAKPFLAQGEAVGYLIVQHDGVRETVTPSDPNLQDILAKSTKTLVLIGDQADSTALGYIALN